MNNKKIKEIVKRLRRTCPDEEHDEYCECEEVDAYNEALDDVLKALDK